MRRIVTCHTTTGKACSVLHRSIVSQEQQQLQKYWRRFYHLQHRNYHHGVVVKRSLETLGSSERDGLVPMQSTTSNSNQSAVMINTALVALGKDGNWNEILSLYKAKKERFNYVNYATAMSQLGRIHQRHQIDGDPSFNLLLDDLSKKFLVHGITWVEHGGVRVVANIVHAIGKLGLSKHASAMNILKVIGEDEPAEWLFANGNPQQIANCIWAFGTLRIQSPNLFRLLDERAEWLVENGNAQNVSNCVWACGKLGVKSNNLFRLLDEHSERLMVDATPQGLANCVWACAKVGIVSPKLFRVLDKRADWLLGKGAMQEIANCIWACGTLGIKSPTLFLLLDKNAAWLFQQWNSVEIAKCVLACAKLGIRPANVLEQLDLRSEWLMANGTTQAVANCVWACGTLRLKNSKMFKLIDHRAEWMIANGSQQESINCVWACGAAGVYAPNLFRLLDKNAVRLLMANGTPQDFSNACWAYAKVNINAPNLFRLLDERSEWLFKNSSPQEIVNCLWACGTLGYPVPNLFRLLDQNPEWLFQKNGGTTQSLANALWACSKLNIDSPNLVRLLGRRAEWFVENGTSQEIANCAWALSVAGSQCPEFFAALDRSLDKFLVNADLHNLCNVCYAIAIFQLNVVPERSVLANVWDRLTGQESAFGVEVSIQSGMLVKLWDNLVRRLNTLHRQAGRLPHEELGQIIYVQKFASLYGIELESPYVPLQEPINRVPISRRSSNFEAAVSKTLTGIGFSHTLQVSPFQFSPGLLSIDMACSDRMIAIECDGPSHYVSRLGNAKKLVENGSTKAKRRMLQQLGWNVINLNWEEARDHQAREKWVRKKLAEAGVEL